MNSPLFTGPAPAYGAIDLGTNNCRMLVARPFKGSFRVVDSFSRIVRLGEGVSAEGRLSEDAITRTISALKVCRAKLRSKSVQRIRSVATEACRRAENGVDFLARVKEEACIELETISPQEEAALTLRGCSPLLDPSHPNALVFDIGGGSTEVVWIDTSTKNGPRARDVISLPHGVVTLTEDYDGRTNAGESYEDIVRLIDESLGEFDRRNAISKAVGEGRVQMLGTSGTVTTLGALHLKLSRYDRARVDGLSLRFGDICTVVEYLGRLDHDARMQHPCIGPRRGDLIMAGCAVLDAVCRRWPVGSLVIADRGIREGILMDLMCADGHGKFQ
ncbi:MAG: Ppx/GppA family phosphatase [Alphaproteobacteria bacterium]|nr:Ppx/GppA family phosphatase [Alphaproteobacteria bacterium]MBF0252170.1 Ppx/GppA family phosphatase [Alphaproteobacteria bacterium]